MQRDMPILCLSKYWSQETSLRRNISMPKVLLGLTISKKQVAILMHLEYKVALPDHDFMVDKQHKLILSVTATCLKKYGRKAGYSGPTLISIRYKKHNTYYAQSYTGDFATLITCEEFREIATVWKVSKYGVFSGPYFPVLELNTGNTDQGKLFI